ncbi:MAG: hypothetical protein HYR64_08330 [Fimbriimonas ginsengisoli]|uniref:Uncharacterized protein n=1 Tax=Fimbriimonas ginsengisoli TaxID=1005039 RepID=A0A931PW99_FIMGI|nr:hypothetical protein [Fimbriimonas ginsengisoli]
MLGMIVGLYVVGSIGFFAQAYRHAKAHGWMDADVEIQPPATEVVELFTSERKAA